MVKDLNMPLTITGCPIIREADGLAKKFLQHLSVYRGGEAALGKAVPFSSEKRWWKRESATAKDSCRNDSGDRKEPLAKIDYVKIVDLGHDAAGGEDRQRNPCRDSGLYGKTRLIDNFMYELEN